MAIDIEKNKQDYINLLKTIKDYRDCDVDKLIEYLESTDFFTAPCTTQHHNSVEGGLCAHALNVYDNLDNLVSQKSTYGKCRVSPETITIVALCKDFGKINYYESYIKNEKVYHSDGSKSDNYGKFDWEGVEYYKVKDFKYRDCIGDLGFNAYNIVSQYIPLTKEEVATLLNCDLGMNNKYTNGETLNIASKYRLVALTHCAEILASYVDERDE